MEKSRDQYPLKFDEGLRDKIKSAAAENRRSMNAEINFRLQHSLMGETPEETKNQEK